jgi:catechol 2,3-dioxygenase-like lactoylglutathione lyase family enzyme
MKLFPWLILFVLGTTFPASAQEQTPVPAPSIKLVAVTILVKDYDKAAKWYSENLGFEVRDNKDLRPGKRWVAMYSKDDPHFQMFLHQPGNGYMPVDKELLPDRIGKETFWILRTTDFDAMVKRLKRERSNFPLPDVRDGRGRKGNRFRRSLRQPMGPPARGDRKVRTRA